ncbi:MAG TPA: antibiotic biosynthesis monooxygenase, partial [Acidimicrobiales bacterium]|nr:antibiotic biosynthesis monooxygenase [Acidimicrobiales bacterium]
MILEHAILDVVPGREADFQKAFASATAIISSMPGFNTLVLRRSVETPSRFLLLVEWSRLEDHMEGFRGSPQYEGWKQLLHH